MRNTKSPKGTNPKKPQGFATFSQKKLRAASAKGGKNSHARSVKPSSEKLLAKNPAAETPTLHTVLADVRAQRDRLNEVERTLIALGAK